MNSSYGPLLKFTPKPQGIKAVDIYLCWIGGVLIMLRLRYGELKLKEGDLLCI